VLLSWLYHWPAHWPEKPPPIQFQQSISLSSHMMLCWAGCFQPFQLMSGA
jgi:hypothetical protein